MRQCNRGLDLTFKTIDSSHCTATADLIVRSLESRHVKVRRWAFGRALASQDRRLHRELIRHLEHMPEQVRASLARARRTMTAALRIALLGNDAFLRVNASTIALEIREYTLIPDLIRFVKERERVDDTVGWTVLQLADYLRTDLTTPRRKSEQTEMEAIAEECREAVEAVLPTFHKHRSRPLLEAYLILAGTEDERILDAVAQPRSLLGSAILDIFEHGTSEGIRESLAHELISSTAPTVVKETLRRRKDVGFAKYLLRSLPDGDLTETLRQHPVLGEMEFLRDDAFPFEELDETEQTRLVHLITKSDLPEGRRIWLLEYLSANGAPAARAATVTAIGRFSNERAALMIERLLYDPSREVVAAALNQLRVYDIPGGIDLAFELRGHPDARIRGAARAVLSEADFIEFFNEFPHLNQAERRRKGRLAFKADPKAVVLLRRELSSLSRERQLRGLEAAVAMGACEQVRDEIVARLEDKDGTIRQKAAQILREEFAPVPSRPMGSRTGTGTSDPDSILTPPVGGSVSPAYDHTAETQ